MSQFRFSRCLQCRKLAHECKCPPRKLINTPVEAVLRIEKSGRKGKTVTVIDRLPRMQSYLEDLAKVLKTRCGTGGTCFVKPTGGVIEIQGDQRQKIRAILAEQGVKTKG